MFILTLVSHIARLITRVPLCWRRGGVSLAHLGLGFRFDAAGISYIPQCCDTPAGSPPLCSPLRQACSLFRCSQHRGRYPVCVITWSFVVKSPPYLLVSGFMTSHPLMSSFTSRSPSPRSMSVASMQHYWMSAIRRAPTTVAIYRNRRYILHTVIYVENIYSKQLL